MSEKTPINDDRLTRTMKRVRSGRTQVFTEQYAKDDNNAIRIQHERKEMYAELIDGEWYWVNGCAECNGEPRDWMTYIECEKHDRCSVCGINAKEIKGAGVWGGKHGWTCNSCHDAEELDRRNEAFSKLDGEEPDCSYRDQMICPHCGSELCSDDIRESQDTTCYVCTGGISVEVEYSFHYTTTVKGKRITE
ncbi:MAG: hypothetical protein ACEPOW_13970 [Bacteroidales bacterium]